MRSNACSKTAKMPSNVRFIPKEEQIVSMPGKKQIFTTRTGVFLKRTLLFSHKQINLHIYRNRVALFLSFFPNVRAHCRIMRVVVR